MGRNILKFLTAFLSLLLINNACLEQEIDLPRGWRRPTNSEVTDGWRDEGINKYLWFKADLNGDGTEDQANILVSKDNKKMSVFAFVSHEDGKYKTFMLEEMNIKYIENAGIKAVPPGRYVTWCGKGARDCLEGEPNEIYLSYKAIELFFWEKSSRYFYWDNLKKEFKSVWITD
jgi:hypothetical protein